MHWRRTTLPTAVGPIARKQRLHIHPGEIRHQKRTDRHLILNHDTDRKQAQDVTHLVPICDHRGDGSITENQQLQPDVLIQDVLQIGEPKQD